MKLLNLVLMALLLILTASSLPLVLSAATDSGAKTHPAYFSGFPRKHHKKKAAKKAKKPKGAKAESLPKQ